MLTWIQNICLVALGGGIGSVLRYGISWVLSTYTTTAFFPLATFIANCVGCFLIGYWTISVPFSAYPAKDVKLLLLTGFCGGFTTLSTFSLETLRLWQQAHYAFALLYILLTNSLGIAFVALGMWLATNKTA